MAKRMFVRTILFFVALAVSTLGFAQTTATLSGVVSDASGAVLPGAQITVTNTGTGIRRIVTTDSAGRFTASQLAPGPYEVTATVTGFETLRREGITLAIGQEANLTLALKVGAVSEQVTVTAEAPIVNTSTSSVSGVVDERRIEELPLNGRDFSQLPLVQTGVTAIRNGDATVSKGYGARISMGGSRPDQTAWLLDGTNIHSVSNFGTPGSAAGVMLGVEAVREFQVLTSNYSADLGGTSGGVVNMVTKSGTNLLHGSLFEFLRNSALDARNFFDPDKPAFKRNQFGGAIGGAIKKDKTFFFGNYEGLRQRQGVTTTATVPDSGVHQGLIPTAGGALQQVTVAPEIRPYLELIPLPNGPAKGPGLGILFASGNAPVNENYFVVRMDHHLTDKQSLFGRFTFDQGNATQADALPVTDIQVAPRTRYTTIQHDLIVSPRFLMTTRVAYNRTLLSSDDFPLVNYSPSLNLFLPGYLPTLSYTGINVLGPAGQNLVHRAQNYYDFQEHFQYLRGSHSIRFGGQFDKVGTNKANEISGINGTFTWNTVQDFVLDNRLSSFAAVAKGTQLSRTYRQYFYGAYFQDDWKMRPNFTWNLGVRYEPFSTPSEKYGRLATLKDWVSDTAFQTGIGLFKNPSLKDFSPRVGFAWDPKGDGKTAVRSAFGLFFVDLNGPYYITAGQKDPPFFGATAVVQPAPGGTLATSVADVARITPEILSAKVSPNSFGELIQYNLNPSYELKFNLAVERQLPGNLSVTAGYLGGRGVHLWRSSDANDPLPIQVNGRSLVVNGAPRPNALMGVASTRYSDVMSFYNSLQLEVKKRFGHGLQFQSSYTWSKNIDDSTTGVALTDFTPGGQGTASQPNNPKGDRALSSLNVGQSLVVNGIYSIPSPAHSGVTSALLGGWQLASIVTATSGSPFSIYVSGRNAPDGSRYTGIQFPDRVAGRNSSNSTSGTTAGCSIAGGNQVSYDGKTGIKPGQKVGTPNLYFDPCSYILPPAAVGYPAGSGFYGNAGRNSLIGPGLVNFDFSLHKSTPLGIREGSRLEFHADVFNLFNRANFANPRAAQSQVVNPTSSSYVTTAGQITNTVTSSRQMQFGLKLVF